MCCLISRFEINIYKHVVPGIAYYKEENSCCERNSRNIVEIVENIAIMNIYIYMCLKCSFKIKEVMELLSQIDKFIIIVRDFNLLLSKTDLSGKEMAEDIQKYL